MYPFQVADNNFITSLLPHGTPRYYANTSRRVQIHLICINLLAKQEVLNISTLCMHSPRTKYQQRHTVFPWVLSLSHTYTHRGRYIYSTVSLSQFPTGCSYSAFFAVNSLLLPTTWYCNYAVDSIKTSIGYIQ